MCNITGSLTETLRTLHSKSIPMDWSFVSQAKEAEQQQTSVKNTASWTPIPDIAGFLIALFTYSKVGLST